MGACARVRGAARGGLLTNGRRERLIRPWSSSWIKYAKGGSDDQPSGGLAKCFPGSLDPWIWRHTVELHPLSARASVPCRVICMTPRPPGAPGPAGLSSYLPLHKVEPLFSHANAKTPILMCHGDADQTVGGSASYLGERRFHPHHHKGAKGCVSEPAGQVSRDRGATLDVTGTLGRIVESVIFTAGLSGFNWS